mmetsp:Transcript_31425/g.56992  ORF Transcript_31425/g.56992 Transcript_31425/m.56992 type:complete len:261 (-) Transcript_31425:28-810(-)
MAYGQAAGQALSASRSFDKLQLSAAIPAALGRREAPIAETFLQYRHAQQQAHLLVPSLPQHSRIDELDRVWDRARAHEERRIAVLSLLDSAERRRMDGLRRARSLVQMPVMAQETERLLQASCTLPELKHPCGDYTAAAMLMNRRVDVNRARKSRSDVRKEQKKVLAVAEAEQAIDRESLSAEIASFESSTWPLSRDAAGETALDWTGTRPLRKPCAAREPVHMRGKLADTAASWGSRSMTQNMRSSRGLRLPRFAEEVN